MHYIGICPDSLDCWRMVVRRDFSLGCTWACTYACCNATWDSSHKVISLFLFSIDSKSLLSATARLLNTSILPLKLRMDPLPSSWCHGALDQPHDHVSILIALVRALPQTYDPQSWEHHPSPMAEIILRSFSYIWKSIVITYQFSNIYIYII